MSVQFDFVQETALTIERLLPNLKPMFKKKKDLDQFLERLSTHLPRALEELLQVYSGRYDFFFHLEQIIHTCAQMSLARPADLRRLDLEREANPYWYKHEGMIGGVCYVDLFAGDLVGIKAKIPYFQELGLTYLHLMPLFLAPEENNDGGYAVSDFRTVNPALGTMEELASLAADFRKVGISLTLDFVFNHTSDEHAWAKAARAGDNRFKDFYYFFPDRTIPDQYERTLREIFPDHAPGSFTYLEDIQQWVWTTFNTFQWDLNYSNPDVFNAMLGEMLFLANQGVEILRLDAVAFIWKQMGTTCENLPQAHHIIRALNAFVRIAAPAMLFKSEAIVHPDDVASYISWEECPVSYNPTYMALIWEALATREVRLLRHSMSHRFSIEPRSTWVNYVRVHDDIGWSFANEDAIAFGINGFDHRQFLNQFYTGSFPGSFATGLGFNFNPETLDMRICGTTASLCGLEKALEADDPILIDLAMRRIIMIHSVMIAAGGIPLIYLGDEIATPNDYSFREIPGKSEDERWVHRPAFDWERAESRHDPNTPPGKVFTALLRMITARKNNPALSDEQTTFFDNGNPHVLSFLRNRTVLVLANFSEQEQAVNVSWLKHFWTPSGVIRNLISDEPIVMETNLKIAAYDTHWLIGVID